VALGDPLPAIAGRRPPQCGKRSELRKLAAHRFQIAEFRSAKPDQRFRRIDIMAAT
jgi:hypothetical protein